MNRNVEKRREDLCTFFGFQPSEAKSSLGATCTHCTMPVHRSLGGCINQTYVRE